MKRHQFERHYSNRSGWLRAAVLGANDGIVSVASLLVGVAATHVSRSQALVVGVAGLVGGAMSMAAGEYVSVSSQADSERSDLERERRELAADEPSERAELAGIYVQRGLTPALAEQVAAQLMQKDALAAHARDELGMSAMHRARPLQASMASASSFATGALLPLLVVLWSPLAILTAVLAASSLLFLALLGGLAARAGGAPIGKAALRVTFWGALAMAVTAAVGSAFGALA
ncbi:MAG TPA: VIT family protein [Steroidobacteraceae bacterium]|jgi:VIT1/CCC1 family predicted Fe2+/Mn2+ transporter|nr:VIT family protein [Steroidobacteraceae bacterium]